MPSFIASLPYGPLGRLANGLALLFVSALPVCAAQITLVAFGDSLTQGYGLPQDQGFTAQLQAYLTAAGDDVLVINAGVSGDTTAGGAARIDWTLTPDVDAVIVNLGGNDLLRGLPPAEARRNLDKIAATISAKSLPFLIVPHLAPGNYGPEYKAAFDAIYPEIAAQYGAAVTDPYFAPLTGTGADPAAAASFMQADGIHPNAEGVAKIIAHHGPALRALLQKVPQ